METDSRVILETERLYLREMTRADYAPLCEMLQDAECMYAYEHAFSDAEAHEWLERQLGRYRSYGFGLWAVILKESEQMIGQCGITMQDCGGVEKPEIGYIFNRSFWHNGYAIEAASACRTYAFETLGFDEVCSIIRENNLPSRRVAERNGMKATGSFVKHYYGMDMPHIVYTVRRERA